MTMMATHYLHAYWRAQQVILSAAEQIYARSQYGNLRANQGLRFIYQYRPELTAYHLYRSTMSYPIFFGNMLPNVMSADGSTR